MLPVSSTTTTPRRRQTCDPCRAAKIKCDKRTPICGRCLATGGLCGYGVSRQGAWWRQKENGKVVSKRNAKDQESLRMPDHLTPGSSNQNYSSVASLLFSRPVELSDVGKEVEEQQHLDLATYSIEDFEALLRTQQSAGSTTTRLPMDDVQSVSPSYNDTLWSSQFTKPETAFDNGTLAGTLCDAFQSQSPIEPAISGEIHNIQGIDIDHNTCRCYATVLQALQALEESFPAPSSENLHQSSSKEDVTAIMQHNERTLQCCLAIIRCQSCREERGRFPMILLLTLISREVALTEDWACSSRIRSTQNSIHLQVITTDKSLRIELAQVGTRRLSEMLVALKQTSQSVSCDFTRLAHGVLVESLMVNVRNTLARLDLQETKAAKKRRGI